MVNKERVKPQIIMLLSSLVILFFIFGQSAATFRLFCPPDRFTQLTAFRVICEPQGYPFLNYPMYNLVHYEGDEVIRYLVFGVLEDSSELEVHPEDLGLNIWLFNGSFITSILANDIEIADFYAEEYQVRNNVRLTHLRLENHPVILTRDGPTQGPRRILNEISLNR